MSEGAPVEPGQGLDSFGKNARFDDRIDLATNITNIQALGLIGRALVLLRNVKALFAGKMVLAALALIPGLTVPFLAKITVDQVLLGKSFDDIEIPFPPHIVPFVDAVSGLGQMEIMLAVIAFTAVLLFLFGRGGLFVWIGGGADSASTSELKLNAGRSAVSGVFGVVETWINIRLTQRLANALRTRLFNRLAQLPMSRLDDHRIGDSVYRVMYDAPDVPEISLGLTLEPIFTLIGVFVTLYLLQYSYDQALPNLVWVAGLLVPVGLLATLPASGLIRRVQQASRAAGTATTNAIEESMSNIAAVQSLGGMARDKARIEAKSDESYRRYRHVVLMQIAMWALSALLTIGLGIYVAVSVLGGIINGSMTPGDFAAVFGFALSIGGAVSPSAWPGSTCRAIPRRSGACSSSWTWRRRTPSSDCRISQPSGRECASRTSTSTTPTARSRCGASTWTCASANSSPSWDRRAPARQALRTSFPASTARPAGACSSTVWTSTE